jgi:hypothetical protein
MSAKEFFEEASTRNIRLDLPSQAPSSSHSLSNEALFQLPLLAMTIIALSKGRSKPLLEEIGQLVGECLERTVVGFKGSSQEIGWSGNLRIRTIKALSFLELTKQIIVDARTSRIEATDLGKQVFSLAVSDNSPLAYAMQTIELSYQYIRDENRIEGTVSETS